MTALILLAAAIALGASGLLYQIALALGEQAAADPIETEAELGTRDIEEYLRQEAER